MISVLKRVSKIIKNEGRVFYSSVRRESFSKKMFFFVKIILLLPFAFFVHLGMLSINLFRPVRLGLLNGTGRPSRMIPHIESLVRKIKLIGVETPLIIMVNPGSDPNEQLTKMYKRVIWLLDEKNPLLRFLFAVTHVFFSSYSKTGINLVGGLTEEYVDSWQKGKPVISFTREEENEGKKFLKQLGIPEGAQYICIGFRDLDYYEHLLTQTKQKMQTPFLYNPSLSAYLPMMIDCAEQGFCVVYMGQFSKSRLPKNLHPKIIDYSPNIRMPFYDVYLLANCKFTIAAGAPGIWWFSTAFNKPIILIDNYVLRAIGLRKGDLCIYKKWYLIKEKRLLTFKEIIGRGVAYFFMSKNCERDGIIPIHNTPGEIKDVVQEMIERLNGTWKTAEEDEFLQEKFTKLFKPNQLLYLFQGRIGSKFLRGNSKLLA